jgi:Sodium:sulfate symporter transmembrane region
MCFGVKLRIVFSHSIGLRDCQ